MGFIADLLNHLRQNELGPRPLLSRARSPSRPAVPAATPCRRLRRQPVAAAPRPRAPASCRHQRGLQLLVPAPRPSPERRPRNRIQVGPAPTRHHIFPAV